MKNNHDSFPIGTPVLARSTAGSTFHEFSGVVVDHRFESNGRPLFTVEDQDGDCFDMEEHELQVSEE